MIRVTRINNSSIVLNCDLIEHLKTVPETMIALTNGQQLFVQETVEEIIDRVVDFRRRTLAGGICCRHGEAAENSFRPSVTREE